MRVRNTPSCRDDAGFALVAVIGFGAVVTLLVTTAMMFSFGALSSSRQHVSYGQALDAAENGISQSLSRLQAAHALGTNYYDPTDPVLLDVSSVAAADKSASGYLSDPVRASEVQHSASGDYLAIVPQVCNAANTCNSIYSMSWSPSRASPRKVRLLKSEYVFSTYQATYAALTGGDLDIGGSVSVVSVNGQPDQAKLHTNGDLTVDQASVDVAGSLTSTGSYDVHNGVSVGTGSRGGAPQQSLPPINPRAIYNSQSAAYPNNWYDLCPDGRVLAAAAVVAGVGATPCTGTVLATSLATSAVAAGPGFFGWTWKSSGGVTTWSDGNTHVDGVYYAYRSNLAMTNKARSPWKVTAIAEADTSGGICLKKGGNIRFAHQDIGAGYVSGLIFAAGQDLSGSAESTIGAAGPGLVGAADQMNLDTSSTDIYGSLVTNDECDTAGSPVLSRNTMQGVTIHFSSLLDLPLGALVRTSLWGEVHP